MFNNVRFTMLGAFAASSALFKKRIGVFQPSKVGLFGDGLVLPLNKFLFAKSTIEGPSVIKIQYT